MNTGSSPLVGQATATEHVIRKKSVMLEQQKYQRLAIKTHFIKRGEDYTEVIKNYVSPQYQPGDILFISEKIISICQNNVIEKKISKSAFGQSFYQNLL